MKGSRNNNVGMFFLGGAKLKTRISKKLMIQEFHLPNTLKSLRVFLVSFNATLCGNPSKRTCKTLQGEHQPTISPPITRCPIV